MRRTKHIFEESSLLTGNLTLGLLLVGGLLAAYFRQSLLSLLLILILLLMSFARLWAHFALRRLEVDWSLSTGGLFPGEKAVLRITLQNGKFLPLPWSSLYLPLPENLCVLPEETRETEGAEAQALRDDDANPDLVGEVRLPYLGWYGEMSRDITLEGKRRGIFRLKNAALRSGDGLGLTVEALPLAAEDVLAVFPAWQPVRAGLLTRNLWNAETGNRGYQEEPTLIRSMRPYMPGDRARDINWRMAANAQPLSLNLHETILPHSLHFILDGESFFRNMDYAKAGCSLTELRQRRMEELEETLSILASLLLSLDETGTPAGLSLCSGASGDAFSLDAAVSVLDKLYALSAYQPCPIEWEEGARELKEHRSIFRWNGILREEASVGRYLYIARDAGAAGFCGLQTALEEERVRQLLWQLDEKAPGGAMELLALREAAHEE